MGLMDDLAGIARPRSTEYIAGMAEGNERGSNAAKLARLIAAVDIRITELACNPASKYLSNHVASELRAAIEEAKR